MIANSYLPVTSRNGPAGDTVITTFNLYNLFDKADPAALLTKLAKLALAITFELRRPHIVVLQEIGSAPVLQLLADRLNESGAVDYQATSFLPSDRRGIRVGFLWDRQRVALTQAYPLSGAAVAAAFGPDSPHPGREPLVGVFTGHGQQLTIVANHFKSDYVPIDQEGDGATLLAMCRNQRLAQARVVRDFVNGLLDANAEALVMVAGDLNDTIPAADAERGSTTLGVLGGGPGERPLINLLPALGPADAYTFISDGRPALLDHLLVSPALWPHTVAAQTLPFNTNFPETMQDDPRTACRASDHDPLEGRFVLASA